MFKYSTSTLVNGKTYVDGTPAWHYVSAGTITYADDTTATTKNTKEKSFVLAHNNKFEDDNVVSVTYAPFKDAAKEKVTVDLTKATFAGTGLVRLFLYLRTTNPADPFLANDFVYKGTPLFIEAKATTATEAATALVTASKKWLNLQYDGKALVTLAAVESVPTSITIECSDPDHYLYDVELAEFVEPSDTAANRVWASDGYFKTLASSLADSPEYIDKFVEVNTAHCPGYGTYAQIIKDLRLPTNANARFYRDKVDEMPLVNGQYWQFVITECTERPEMQGTSVLGQYNKSVTSHVIFVENAVKDDFLTDLTAALPTVFAKDAVEKKDKANNDTVYTEYAL